MPKLALDPPSGYANSYLDVRFVAEFEQCNEAEITLYNLWSKERLEVLAAFQGYIDNGNTVIVKNTHFVDGYINLFNRDKTNQSLSGMASVDIECRVKRKNNDEITEETVIATFYNESQSVDNEIAPFDIIIHNSEIDVNSNMPIKLTIISNESQKHELSIKSDQGNQQCVFEVITKPGSTTIDLPLTIVFNDLHLQRRDNRKFDIYWVKFQGTDLNKFMNRNYIKIPNTTIVFNGNEIILRPQKRQGPIKILSEDFVLSDRYYVHTHKNFSGFGGVGISQLRIKKLCFFMHESQNMQKISNILESNTSVQLEQIRKTIRQSDLSNKRFETFGVSKQKQFLENFSNAYAEHFDNSVTEFQSTTNVQQQNKTNLRKSGGCGCSRK